jgi:uncharacterized protein (TIGR01777 family)
MEIIICGTSGLIGRALVDNLGKDNTLTLVGRDETKLKKLFGDQLTLLTWNELTLDHLKNKTAIINLTGENIAAAKWSDKQKQKILTSRIESTQKISHLCAQLGTTSPRILNANAIGIYGTPEDCDTIFNESSVLPNPPTDFLSEVGIKWLSALDEATKSSVSVTTLRFGVVLDKQDGALAKILPSFKFGMGAIIGSGKQPFSWVALDDVVRAIEFLLGKPDATGAFNIVADEIPTQEEFAKALAAELHRPCFMRLPAAMIKIMFGQMGEELLLSGAKVKAMRLKELGFNFKFPEIKPALKHILQS